MQRFALIALAALAMTGVAFTGRAEAAGECKPFSGFPLSINFGLSASTGTGESANCFGQKVQAAFNTLGQPNGIASLDAAGRLPSGQLPQAATFGTLTLTGFGSTGDVSGMRVTQPGLVSRLLSDKLSERLSVMDGGGICDGTTDAGSTINTMLSSGLKQISIPKGAVCRSSVTINIPGASILEGSVFAPGNPATGSTILCDANVSPCIRIGNKQQPFGGSLRRMIVKRAGGTPTSDKIGVLVDGDYNPIISDVMAYNHGQGFVLRANATAGLGGQFTRIFTGAISDAHVVLDGWPEARFSHYRFGMNGGGDYASNTFVRVQGGVAGSASGPNTMTFINGQMNQATAAVHHVVEFVNLSAPVPSVDAQHFDIESSHLENIDQAVYYSDASWNLISRTHLTNTSINAPGTPLFALNPATSFDDVAIIGNVLNVLGLSLLPNVQINQMRLIGNRIDGITSIAAGGGGGATATVSGNAFGGNLVISGVWGQFNAFGNTWSSGSFVNNASGSVAVADALNGGVSLTREVVLYGQTDANGNATISHGISSASQRVASVTGVVRGNSGEAVSLSGSGSSPGITSVDGSNVYIVAGSTFASRRLRLRINYTTASDPNWP